MTRLWAAFATVAVFAITSVPSAVAAPTPRVLRVGRWNGLDGDYASVQSAVDGARPDDWILIGPGDYHEQGAPDAGVMITKPHLHLRGMNRNSVIIDGTRPGSAACDSAPAAQQFGPLDAANQSAGRNGVVVKALSPDGADGVTIENLTVCNYLSSASGARGNEIWWNGGDGSGHQWLGAFAGSFLNATTTYSDASGGPPAAMYGIFVSNTHGPGTIAYSYANNAADAAFYVGACPDCNVTLDHVHGQHSAQAYSGTNSGGRLVITDSEFDDNLKGIAPNSMNDDDAPSPQDGACPPGVTGPGGAATCAVIRRNFIHDNNDPSVPRLGIMGAGIGSGIVVAGGRNNTIIDNTITHNGLFGIAIVDYPDTETPAPIAHCQDGINGIVNGTGVCYFVASGNEVAHNVLDGNGFFGNSGDADLASGATSVTPGNCFHDNTSPSGHLTSTPPAIQTVDGHCGGPSIADARTGIQLSCAGTLAASGGPACPAMHYPTASGVTLLPLSPQATMADPCTGVPANPWCPATPKATARAAAASAGLPRTGGSTRGALLTGCSV